MIITKTKYFVSIILLFTVANCFAVNQKLIHDAEKYDIAVEKSNEIEIYIKSTSDSLKYWTKNLNEAKSRYDVSDSMKNFYYNKIDETKKELQNFDVLFNATKETLKTLEPLKKEYDKQIEIESKQERIKTEILNITGMIILPLAFFGIIILLGIYKHKKYKRLLQSGKISQQEYNNIMCNRSTIFDDDRTNPATGLRMIGGIDSGGNPSGCSFKSGSSFDIYQDYRDRHRWD